MHTPYINQTNNYSHINKLRFILFLCGTLTVLLGVYATVPRLVEVATEYFSPDGHLSERGIAWVSGLRLKIILTGAVVLVLALLPRRLVNPCLWLTSTVLEKCVPSRTEVMSVLSTARLALARSFSMLFRVATDEKLVWCLVVLIFLSIQVPAIFLSAHGGLHAEGIDLNPAKNLARHGVYGTLTTRGFDDLTYRISAGPGILVPQAVVFKLFGVDVDYARALHVAYQLALVVIFYHVGRYLYGKGVALLSLVLFAPLTLSAVVSGSDGYAPAMFYLLTGALCWFKSVERGKTSYLWISGVFWGLAFQTKWLFLFAVFALLVTWLILRLSSNPLPSRYWIIPCSMVLLVTAIWVGFRIFNIGLREEYFHVLRFWQEHGHRGIPGFAILRPVVNLSGVDLWAELQLFLLVPALLYAMMAIKATEMSDYKSMFLGSFVALWLGWWLLFNSEGDYLGSIHVHVVRHLSQVFVARFLYDLWNYASEGTRQINAIKYSLRVLVAGVVLTAAIPPIVRQANKLYVRNMKFTSAFNEMVAYVRNNTESDAVFSGWDWSLPWHIDLDESGDRLIKDRATYPPEHREGVSEYFIVSPEWPLVPETDEWPNVSPSIEWGLRENAMRKGFLEKHASLVRSFPAGKHKWMLFKINDTSVARPASETQSPSPTSNSVQDRLGSQRN